MSALFHRVLMSWGAGVAVSVGKTHVVLMESSPGWTLGCPTMSVPLGPGCPPSSQGLCSSWWHVIRLRTLPVHSVSASVPGPLGC